MCAGWLGAPHVAFLWGQVQAIPKAERGWLDPNRTVEDRVAALVSAMTLEEKVGQLSQTNGIGGVATGNVKSLVEGSKLYELIRNGHIGSILNEPNLDTVNELQRVAVEESRLGIPLIVGRDVIHGFRTIFPIPLGQAASWNPDLVEQACAVAAREARSRGVHWTFAPMMDIARDPRWGRIAEGFGEDPYLASVLAAASVRGYQGEDYSAGDRVVACAKHFVGYGAAEGGRDYNTTVISPSLMRNVYLPPFHAAVQAGVGTVMCAFNDVNGIPMSANKHLLRNVLRDDWGFSGFVVSDWESILEMIPHGYAADEHAAAVLSARAGVNMEMASPTYRKSLPSAVRDDEVPDQLVNRLVQEVLRVKFRLGLFEHSYVDTNRESVLLSPKHLQTARQLATQSVVLLKNENQALPLQCTKLTRLAVIGPLADAKRDQLGCWIPDGREDDSRTPLAAIREAAGQVEVLYVAGLADDVDQNTERFAEAVAAARQADAVIVIVGERANLSGEARSRGILELPGAQSQLVAAIAAVGKPTVMIVQSGRPLTIGEQIEQVDAVLYSFHGGTMAGPALADLLFGEEPPSGKLPVTFLKSVGQVPLYYNHVNTGRPPRAYNFERDRAVKTEPTFDLGYNSNYLDVTPYPLYPFGYGLSYTTFQYGDAELSATKLKAGQVLAVRVPVTNTGNTAGDEIVQLYVHDLVASLVRPVRELKGFRRLHLNAGETQVVEFALSTDDLAFYNNREERVLESGNLEVYVGGSSLAPLAGEFELVD